MENLIFSLNATVPVFLMMVIGLGLRRAGLFSEEFAAKVNKFVFRIPMPFLVFADLVTVDFAEAWNTKFVLFCFFVTVASIAIAAGVSCLWKDKSIRGEFIQAAYRSSAALLGIAFITNIYGNAGMAPLMIIGAVPLYNIMAVVVLTFFRPGHNHLDKALLRDTAKGVITNPIIIGILAGLLWSALKIPMPVIMEKTVTSIGSIASPLGLMAMGATFDIKKAFGKAKPAAVAAGIKLVGFAALFLPLAVWMGFRNEELVAILIMLTSATTVSSYVMARNMGHEGVLSSSVVMLTTLFSAFTITFWIWLLRSLGLI